MLDPNSGVFCCLSPSLCHCTYYLLGEKNALSVALPWSSLSTVPTAWVDQQLLPLAFPLPALLPAPASSPMPPGGLCPTTIRRCRPLLLGFGPGHGAVHRCFSRATALPTEGRGKPSSPEAEAAPPRLGALACREEGNRSPWL